MVKILNYETFLETMQFAVLKNAQNLAKQLGYQPDKRGELTTEMMSGDYEHLLQVFDKHFGDVVILER